MQRNVFLFCNDEFPNCCIHTKIKHNIESLKDHEMASSNNVFHVFTDLRDNFIYLTYLSQLIYVFTAPREELLRVVGLSNDELVAVSDGSFRTKVSWQKPLFNHSAVSHYSYKITNSTQKSVGKIRRRAIDLNTVYTTVSETFCCTFL